MIGMPGMLSFFEFVKVSLMVGVVVIIVIAIMSVLSPFKLWSIDRKLGKIIDQLKEMNDKR